MTTTHDTPGWARASVPEPPASERPPAREGVGSWAARRAMPWALVVAVFAMLVREASEPLSNSDTFFHLRFGREFLDGTWSLRDPGSVTTLGTADWVPTQWLPQVVMAWLEGRFGLAGVAWFAGAQFVLLALVVYLVARRWADPAVAAPLLMFVVIACSSGLSMRPQVMSYALVALTAGIWLGVRAGGRVPWLLIPLTWCWATYHGMWPLGILVGLVACVGLALDGRARGRRLVSLLTVPLGSAVAAALTPVGPRLYEAVVLVSSRGDYFSEWGAPEATSPQSLALICVLGVTALVLLRRGRTDWTLVLLLALAAGWSVYSQRTVPVAAALLVPLAAGALQGLIGPRTAPGRVERGVVWGGAAIALVVLGLVVPHTAAEPAPQPAWAEPVLSALPAGTQILNDSGYGGILMWSYPQLDVLMSGYGDLYTDAELERNSDLEAVEPGWDDLARSTDARVALVHRDSPLGYALQLAGWTVSQESESVRLLRAPEDW